MSDIVVNDIFYYMLEYKPRIVINIGGRDSGKSHFIGKQYIPLKMINKEYFKGVCIRKTYNSLKDSVYSEVVKGIDNMKVRNQFSIPKSELTLTHSNRNKLLFRGLDDPLKIKSLEGISFIFVEEAEDLTEREFWDLLILLRGGKAEEQQLVLAFNPLNEDHFSNEMFDQSTADKVLETFDDGDKKVWIKNLKADIDGEEVIIEALCIKSTYDDNKFIPPIRKAIIEQLKDTDPFLYDVYRKAKYGKKGGRILTNIEQRDFEKEGLKFINFDNKGLGQDFGFNHANCILQVAEKDNCLFIFDELYEYEKDTNELIQLADNKRMGKTYLMYCDSAEPDRIKQWRKAGYKAFPVHKFPGSVNAQILRLKQYKKIYINVSCTNTWQEAKAWMWKQDKRGKFIDEPVTIFDDAMAALRYSTDLFHNKKKVSTMNRKKIGI